MTKNWVYNGDEELVFPSLGIIVKQGDTFEGPDNLNVAGLVENKKAETPKPVSPATTKLGE